MAFEEELRLLAEHEAKEAEAMRLLMLAITESLASGKIVPTDPEVKVMATRSRTLGLEVLARTEASAERFAQKAEAYAAVPGGEVVAAAMRAQAANAAAFKTRVEDFVGYMLAVASLSSTSTHRDDDAVSHEEEEAGCPHVPRSRKPNPKYYGPEWTN
ncbi:hypothetical protein QOZ80_8BG0642780 [Eleusine coracana subsp. coracana]|nr:hypothetical protein QOZ80_8BG0642780 [Eleusine coracana subsp. coracana]